MNIKIWTKVVESLVTKIVIIAFHVRCIWGEMYIGHACLCGCLSLATLPQYCTGSGCKLGNGRGCPLVVHC